ncbi:MAG: hypothetical protein HYV40_05515 [Candidatus Levybacteria bacterium]|nr:hypothetical protein [Candidatus Levybacteria bacterium]
MNRNRLVLIVVGIILVLAIGLIAFQIRKQQETRSRAAGEAVTFSFAPSSQSAVVNNNFTINVSLSAQTNNITGVDIRLSYNTTLVDGVSFQPAGNFNTELINTITDSTGTIRFAAVNTSTTQITGTVPIGTLTVKGTGIGSGDLSLQSAQVTAEGIATALPLGVTAPSTYTITTGTTPTPTANPPTLTPTRTPTPTLTPVPPSATPTRTPTPLPTATPTVVPTSTPLPPTSTPLPQAPQVVLDILLNAIGNGGDIQTPGAAGNFSPINPQRNITFELYETPTGPVIESASSTIIFNQAQGKFTGTISLSTSLANGSYLVRIKTPRYLRRLAPGFITVTQNNPTPIVLSQTTLVVGDSNGDNSLDILDYNILVDCFSIDAPPKACTDPTKKLSADLNDDGNVNGVDINYLVRNATARTGE